MLNINISLLHLNVLILTRVRFIQVDHSESAYFERAWIRESTICPFLVINLNCLVKANGMTHTVSTTIDSIKLDEQFQQSLILNENLAYK